MIDGTNLLGPLDGMSVVELARYLAHLLGVYDGRDLFQLDFQSRLLYTSRSRKLFLQVLHSRIGSHPSIDFAGKDDGCRRYSPDNQIGRAHV